MDRHVLVTGGPAFRAPTPVWHPPHVAETVHERVSFLEHLAALHAFAFVGLNLFIILVLGDFTGRSVPGVGLAPLPHMFPVLFLLLRGPHVFSLHNSRFCYPPRRMKPLTNKQLIAAIISLTLIAAACFLRPYQITNSNGATYKINRITGTTWVYAGKWIKVEE